MQVGTDSYITLEAADAYITAHYRSTSKGRQRWEALTDADKEILIVNACTELELLPFQGRKAIHTQLLAFPRLPAQYGQSQNPPADIQAAQAELALWLSDDTKQADRNKRADLQRQGVKSFSIGDLSESYVSGAGAGPLALACPKAAALLNRYLGGGYGIC